MKQTMPGQANAFGGRFFSVQKILACFKSTLGNIQLDPTILDDTKDNLYNLHSCIKASTTSTFTSPITMETFDVGWSSLS